MPSIRPNGENIAVIKKDSQPSSIIQVANPEKSDTEGVVVAVSPFVMENYPEVTQGATVIFSQFAGSTVELGGEEITFMNIKDILAVLEE